jgi:release factor glutamine methyltransferase
MMLTVIEVIKRTTDFFEKKQIESARLTAELIIAHSLELDRMQLYLQFEKPLQEKELENIRPLVKRRGQGEPLQYVLGTAPFMDFVLKVDKRVLIPRPETEQLVERICEVYTEHPRSFIDLGTGSGAIALALVQAFPDIEGVAVDKSQDALDLAEENAESNGLLERVRFIESDWFSAISENVVFDFVVANPPYLTEDEWMSAALEVKSHEPREALIAEDEGCEDLKKILQESFSRLKKGGRVFLETGIAQHAQLQSFGAECGYAKVESFQDWSGCDRFIVAQKTNE